MEKFFKTDIHALLARAKEFCTVHPRFLGNAALLLGAWLILGNFEPHWQTNDDVTYGMHIGGYGMAAAPGISNYYFHPFYALIVQATPDFFDIHSHTLIQLFLNLASVFIIFNLLTSWKGSHAVKFALVLCMEFHCLLLPQFTLTGFYCAIASILSFLRSVESGRALPLLPFFLFACLSFLLRPSCFLGICLFGIFLYPYKKIFKPKFIAPALITICAFIGLYYADYSIARNSMSAEQLSWNGKRVALTDGWMAPFLKTKPDRHPGLSENDLELLDYHFSADKPLREKATAILDGTSVFDPDFLVFKTPAVKEALALFLDYPFYFLVLAILILTLQRFCAKTLLTLLLFLSVYILIGLFNRGGIWVSRIYYSPLFYLICLLLLEQPKPIDRNWLYLRPSLARCIIFILLITPIFSFTKQNLIQQWRASQFDSELSKVAMNGAIMSAFNPSHIELIYPPFSSASADKRTHFQSALITGLLPNAVKYFDPLEKNGFRSHFLKGFKIAATPDRLEVYEIFCREHLAGEMKSRKVSPERSIPVYHIQCVKPTIGKQDTQ